MVGSKVFVVAYVSLVVGATFCAASGTSHVVQCNGGVWHVTTQGKCDESECSTQCHYLSTQCFIYLHTKVSIYAVLRVVS